MVASFSISARFNTKFELVFVLTNENSSSEMFHCKAIKKSIGPLWKTVLGIFKIALRLKDRHVFMWQLLELFSIFNTITLIKIFWKTQTLFKKLGYRFLVENAKIESTTFQYKNARQKPMLRQIECGVQNRPITKNVVFQ